MIGHIRPMVGHVQTRPDISSLPGLFTILSVDSSWVPHRAFTSCFLALMPCTHSSLVFLKEMARGYERRSKHHHDVSASSSDPSANPRSLPRDHDPAATRRSPPPRCLHLVVVLPMRRSASRCILQRFTPREIL
jgi:hypothetical protein